MSRGELLHRTRRTRRAWRAWRAWPFLGGKGGGMNGVARAVASPKVPMVCAMVDMRPLRSGDGRWRVSAATIARRSHGLRCGNTLRPQNSFEKRRYSPSKLCSKMIEFVIHYGNEYCSLRIRQASVSGRGMSTCRWHPSRSRQRRATPCTARDSTAGTPSGTPPGRFRCLREECIRLQSGARALHEVAQEPGRACPARGQRRGSRWRA